MAMNYREFREGLLDQLRSIFGENYEIGIQTVQKVNLGNVETFRIFDKSGEKQQSPVFYGRKLYEAYKRGTGLEVRRSNNMYVHSEYPFMLADVDRLIVGKENGLIGLECKTASPYSADKWKDGKVPAHYLAQCDHYMAVLNAKA